MQAILPIIIQYIIYIYGILHNFCFFVIDVHKKRSNAWIGTLRYYIMVSSKISSVASTMTDYDFLIVCQEVEF